MSLAALVVPGLFDLAVLMAVLTENHKQVTIMERMEKGLLTAEEAADMQLQVDALRRSGCGVQTGTSTDTRGAAVVIHTDKGYDIDIRPNSKGAYDVVTHWADQPNRVQIKSINSEIEDKIKQKYAYEKVKRELFKRGFTIADEEVQADESIKVVARKW